MGDVWYGHHPTLHVPVAIKTLSQRLISDEEFVKRFMKEAQMAAQIKTQNAVMIYDADVEDGIYYIVMEYVSGGTLKDILEDGQRILPEFAMKWTGHIAEALKAAQKLKIVHRDIKPENIILDENDVAKLADLGIAKQHIHNDKNAGATTTGVIMGTPHYISPEQAENTSTADVRSDIYSLGCSLYEMLTCKVPFEGKSSMMVMLNHTQLPVPNPRDLVSEIPVPLSKVCMKMMAKEPVDRYQTPDELLQDLTLINAGYNPFKGDSTPTKLIIGLVAVIVLLVGLLFLNINKTEKELTNTPPMQTSLAQVTPPVIKAPEPTAPVILPVIEPEPVVEVKPEIVIPPTPEVLPKENETDNIVLTDLDIELLPVKAGTFQMGSPEDEEGRRATENQHEVTISDDFWLSKKEVTVKAFQEFVKDSAYKTDAENNGYSGFYDENGNFNAISNNLNWKNIALRDSDAISMVSYFDAVSFCRWLTKREKANDNIPEGYVYCLPTEAQWEYACRAGSETTPDEDELDEIAYYKENSEFETQLPGQKDANAWGFHDMLGNLQEFVLDRSRGFNWYDVKTTTYNADSTDPISKRGRRAIFRGGSWADEANRCRPASRGHGPRDYSSNNHGFRLALIKATLLTE